MIPYVGYKDSTCQSWHPDMLSYIEISFDLSLLFIIIIIIIIIIIYLKLYNCV